LDTHKQHFLFLRTHTTVEAEKNKMETPHFIFQKIMPSRSVTHLHPHHPATLPPHWLEFFLSEKMEAIFPGISTVPGDDVGCLGQTFFFFQDNNNNKVFKIQEELIFGRR